MGNKQNKQRKAVKPYIQAEGMTHEEYDSYCDTFNLLNMESRRDAVDYAAHMVIQFNHTLKDYADVELARRDLERERDALKVECDLLNSTIRELKKEKLDHLWAERVLPRAIESLSHANAQHNEREGTLIGEVARLEQELFELKKGNQLA